MKSKKDVISAFVEKAKKEAEEDDRANRQVEIGVVGQAYSLQELRRLYQQTMKKLGKYVDADTAVSDVYDFYDYVADLAAMDHSGVDDPDFDPIDGDKDYFTKEVSRLYDQATQFLQERSQWWYWLVIDHPLDGTFFEPGCSAGLDWPAASQFSKRLGNILDILEAVDRSKPYSLIDFYDNRWSVEPPIDCSYLLVRSSDLLAVDCSDAAIDFEYEDSTSEQPPKKQDYGRCFDYYDSADIFEFLQN